MRVASSQFHATMNTALQEATAKVAKVIQQMAIGQRMLYPSDDPIRSVRISRLTREEAALRQYRDNIEALKSRLQQNEAALEGMSADLMQVRDLLVWAADGGNTPDDLNAMAKALESLRDSLFYSANIKDQEGRYMFSGTLTATPALAYDATAAVGARYSFTGNTVEQRVMVGNGITQSANVSLPEMATLLNLLDSAIDALGTPGVNINDPAVRGKVTAAFDEVDVGLGAISGKIATLGGAQTILQTLDDNHANVSLSNQQALITLGQLDYAEAAVKLDGYTSALEATQKAYGKVSGLSLFDVV